MEARGQYHAAAADARRAITDRYLGDEGRRLALAAAVAKAQLAAWYDGDAIEARCESVQGLQALAAHQTPASSPSCSSESPTPPSDSLNPRQLAELTGVNERTARRTIERAVHKRIPGFYRDGWQWRAMPDAFARMRGVRIVSEYLPGGRQTL